MQVLKPEITPAQRNQSAERCCVMLNEVMSCGTKMCHAKRSCVMLNLIQHLSYKGDPESSSG